MAKKIIGLVGSYRRGGVVDSIVDAVLAGAAERGAATRKIYLTDLRIEFCTNCRTCTQAPGAARGQCVLRDDLAGLLDEIERADGVVIGAPVNYYNINALTRKFLERLIVYAYWPWNAHFPQFRVKDRGLPAVLITATAMPALLGRLTTGALRALKLMAQTLGARPIATIFAGMVAQQAQPALPAGILRQAQAAGQKLA